MATILLKLPCRESSARLSVWPILLTPIPTLLEGWVYLFSVIDTFDRTMLASDLFGRCRTQDAPAILGEALNEAFPDGAKGRALRLVHDNGSQFTSSRFSKCVKTLEIEGVRTAYRHPKSMGTLEAWHKTSKVEDAYPKDSRRWGIYRGLGREVQLHSSSRKTARIPPSLLGGGMASGGLGAAAPNTILPLAKPRSLLRGG